MLTYFFEPIFTGSFDSRAFIICTATSLILGCLLAFVHGKLNRTGSSMLLTTLLLPFVVQIVLMLVNGSVGTGIAIAGAFSLVRFRSIQCKPEEIIIIFIATAIGLATSAGYIGVALMFTVIVLILLLLFRMLTVHDILKQHKELRITVPESVDYYGELTDVLEKYTSFHELRSIKTSNMGSLYKLTYDIILDDEHQTKNLINDLRIRNGNLEISLGLFPEAGD